MIFRQRLIHVFLVLCLMFPPSIAMAGDDVLPGDVFTAIMLKALNYDRNIARLAKETIVIGVVYLSGDEPGHDFSNQVDENLTKIKSTFLLKDRPVEGKVLVINKTFDKKTLEELLHKEHVSVLVVSVKDPAFTKYIFETTRDQGISSICPYPKCAQNGASLGIVLKDNKPRMLINLGFARQEGSDYSGKFLALCEVAK